MEGMKSLGEMPEVVQKELEKLPDKIGEELAKIPEKIGEEMQKTSDRIQEQLSKVFCHRRGEADPSNRAGRTAASHCSSARGAAKGPCDRERGDEPVP